MGIFITLPHEQIAAYVRGENKPEIRAQILQLAAEHGAYELLLELIDRVKSRAHIPGRPAATPLPETFAAIEEMLLRFFSGEAGDDEAQQLLDGLASSPHFYRRLLAKLALIAPPPAPEEILERAEIQVRSDEELLAQIKAGAAIAAETAPARPRVRSTSTVWEKWRDGINGILPAPRYAFAITLLVVAGLLVYKQVSKPPGLEAVYVFDQKVPYSYISGLRGEPQAPEESQLYYSFLNNFKLGMSDYVVREYRQAIKTLKTIEPVAQMLVPDNQHDAKLLRDYYFYLGVSHLALSRSQQVPLKPVEKTQELQAAIQCLARADSLALSHRLVGENDRETYFLGLAYGFNHQPDSALVRLNRIKSDSPFYQRSVPLIRAWSRN